MGAWSHEPFGNDDANDWAYELDGVTDLSVIEEALDQALEMDGYLEATEGSIAVAAVEVLAKIVGKGTQTDSYTEKIDSWVKTIKVMPSARLLGKARRVLDRVLGNESELKELWTDAGKTEWLESMERLKNSMRNNGN